MKRWYQQAKNLYHFGQAHFWRLYYGRPERDLTLYGVTGTNGKTTTCVVLGSILRAAFGRKQVGLLTTEVFWLGEREERNATHMTSTDARVVFRLLKQMADAGVTQAVVEMTSHALDQHRLAGLMFHGAIITNITHEHLDYHATMAAYARVKGTIRRYLAPNASLVAKRDGGWVERALTKARSTKHEARIIWFTEDEAKRVSTPLPGKFNQENVLAASLLARAAGISGEAIAQGVAAVRGIPGRVEWLKAPGGFRVLIDFALTPDALERLYAYAREEVSGKIIAVLGAAGRRDRAKRPKIAAVVAAAADEIVLTQDEPYDEDEEQIYRDLEQGLVAATIPWRRIADRREALRYALRRARAGDAVVVTGMGNFSTRAVGGSMLLWNDKKVIYELLND